MNTLPIRSECDCECHRPGVVMMHCIPCCRENPRIVTDKPLDVSTFTRDWAAFAAEVATNKVLAGRLMRVVELALQGPGDDDMAKEVLACETRLVLGMVAAEVRARSGEEK